MVYMTLKTINMSTFLLESLRRLSWTRYRRIGTLVGHRKAVLALAISPDGGFLASGGQF